MNCKVIYKSRGGNTKLVAEAIAKGAGVTAESIENITDFSGVDVLFIGGALYAGKIHPSLKEFISKLDDSAVKTVVIFGSSTSGETSRIEIEEILKHKNIEVSDKIYFCKGSFLFFNRKRPNTDDLKAAEEFAASCVR